MKRVQVCYFMRKQPNHIYHIKGNQIFVVSLDLKQDFKGIKEGLLAYAHQLFA